MPKTPEGDKIDAITKNPITREYSLMDLLKRPEITYGDIGNMKGEPASNPQVAEQVEIAAKYDGYIVRQLEETEQMRRYENTILPADLDYTQVGGLSNEIIQKMSEAKPETLGHASRIQGVTPAALSQLLIYLKKKHSIQKQSA